VAVLPPKTMAPATALATPSFSVPLEIVVLPKYVLEPLRINGLELVLLTTNPTELDAPAKITPELMVAVAEFVIATL